MQVLLGHPSTDVPNPATPAPTSSLLPHVLKGPAALTILWLSLLWEWKRQKLGLGPASPGLPSQLCCQRARASLWPADGSTCHSGGLEGLKGM